MKILFANTTTSATPNYLQTAKTEYKNFLSEIKGTKLHKALKGTEDGRNKKFGKDRFGVVKKLDIKMDGYGFEFWFVCGLSSGKLTCQAILAWDGSSESQVNVNGEDKPGVTGKKAGEKFFFILSNGSEKWRSILKSHSDKQACYILF